MDLHYSQTALKPRAALHSFTTLWIYTILKQLFGEIAPFNSFTTLWIYTILKPKPDVDSIAVRFTTLWIYTILKLQQLPNW